MRCGVTNLRSRPLSILISCNMSAGTWVEESRTAWVANTGSVIDEVVRIEDDEM